MTKSDIRLKNKLDFYIFSLVKKGQAPSKEGFNRFEANEELVKQFAQMYNLDLQMGMIDGKEISFIEKEIARLKDNFKVLFNELERDYIKK